MQQQRTVQLHLPKLQKMDIEFENLRYSVPHGRRGKKEILHAISGNFRSGELTGIMGPSGAGKSSLLNILSGFQKNGISGMIRCAGQDKKYNGKIKYKKDSCYILQDDRLCPLFTVREIMEMAAKLKLGNYITDKAKEILILDILDQLSLRNTLDTKCERLSGGQRKRLSIALELIDNPPIMFLDEPTTGLDSSSSTQCISMLKNLAREGRTIVCTIHQPSATLYELFDQIYVLAEGHCIYQGGAVNTVPYLGSLGLHCPKYHNPADYMLEVANGEYGNFVETLAKAATENKWITPPVDKMLTEKMESDYDERTTVLVQNPSEFYRFGVLLQRSILQLYRDWTMTHLKLILHTLVGIFVGLLYLNYGNDGSKSVKNTGYFIVSIVYLSYTSMMPAIVKLPSEVPVLKKENFNNWYNLSTYYLAYLVSNIPVQIMFSLVYTFFSYTITAQPIEFNRIVMFSFILVLVNLTSEGIGVVIGTTVNPVNGTFLGAILIALLIVVGGFLMLFTHMPIVMYGVSYFSYIAYGMEALVQSMYGFGRESLPCPEDIMYCHYTSPSSLLKEFGMDKDNYNYDVLFLVGNFILAKFVGFCSLKRKLSMDL